MNWILFFTVFTVTIFLSIGPVQHVLFCFFNVFCPFRTLPVNQLLQCGLFIFKWAFCCDLPQTSKVCCCCEHFVTHTGNLTEPCHLTSVFPFFLFLSSACSRMLCHLSDVTLSISLMKVRFWYLFKFLCSFVPLLLSVLMSHLLVGVNFFYI